MMGLPVEWAWLRWRVAGAAALAVLQSCGAAAWPFAVALPLAPPLAPDAARIGPRQSRRAAPRAEDR